MLLYSPTCSTLFIAARPADATRVVGYSSLFRVEEILYTPLEFEGDVVVVVGLDSDREVVEIGTKRDSFYVVSTRGDHKERRSLHYE